MNPTAGQWHGADFLAARTVAMLADQVGFGKSAQVALAIDLIGAQSVVITCPPILRNNWVRELERWSMFPLPVTVMRKASDALPKTGVVIVSHALVAVRRVRDVLRNRGCDVLVADEAHAFRNRKAKRTKYLLGAAGIARGAKRFWAVTGTPTPNNAAEFFVFAQTCGAWTGTYDEFEKQYCTGRDTNFGFKITGSRDDTRDELLNSLRPFVLARQGADPERGPYTEMQVEVPGAVPDGAIDPATIARIEAAVAAGDWKTLDDPIIATARRLIGTAKAEGVAELARARLDGAQKAIIFCQHTDAIDTIANALRSYGVAVIDGRVDAKNRERALQLFQHGDALRVLVCHIRAAGEGLTLTAATRIILAEPSWNPAENTQAIARAWRRGQRDHVHADYAVLAGSIDARGMKTTERKRRDTALLWLGE